MKGSRPACHLRKPIARVERSNVDPTPTPTYHPEAPDLFYIGKNTSADSPIYAKPSSERWVFYHTDDMKQFMELDNSLTWLPQLKLEVFRVSGKARKITARRRFLRGLCRGNSPAYLSMVEESGTEAVTLVERTDEDGLAMYANWKGPFTSSEICRVHQAMQSLWVDKIIPSLNVIQMAAG